MRKLLILLIFLPLNINAQKIVNIDNKHYFYIKDIDVDISKLENRLVEDKDNLYILQRIFAVENYDEVCSVMEYKDLYGRLYYKMIKKVSLGDVKILKRNLRNEDTHN